MKLHHHRLWLAVFGMAACLPTHAVRANITGFSGFSPINQVGAPAFDTAVGYSANFASFSPTDANGNEATSGFYPIPQGILGFTATFNYQEVPQLYNGGPGVVAADGFALVFQNSAAGTAALGASGSGHGWGIGDNNAPGIATPNAALDFNLFGQALNYRGSTSFDLNSVVTPFANKQALTNIDLSTSHVFSIRVSYAGTTLTETLTDTTNTALTQTFTYTNVNLSSILGASTALVGFTGSTGGFNAPQTISNFTFTSVPEPSTWATVFGGACLLGLVRRRRTRQA